MRARVFMSLAHRRQASFLAAFPTSCSDSKPEKEKTGPFFQEAKLSLSKNEGAGGDMS